MSSKSRLAIVVMAFAITVGLLPALTPGTLAQETVYRDDMSNPLAGLLSQSSTDPQYSFLYSNGQYIAQATSPAYRGEIFSFFDTPLLYNSTSSVDVGIGGADEREIYGFIGCRAGADHEGYLFLLEPTTGRAALWRQDATGPV
ncbi:MAG: hypothetical protein AB7V46_12920, partial [Thermomicrobiales bacterium]